jgi:hypothetical protein
VILGQVVEAESGRPVPMAIVTGAPPAPAARGVAPPLGPANPAFTPAAEPKRVYTNSDGRFVLRELANGTYTISVTAAGYQPGASGQTRFGGPSRPVDITDADRVVSTVIRIWKNASITGTVYDETGAPAIGVVVRAVRQPSGGVPTPPPVLQTMTDDRGAFRITNLPPASYLVVAPAVVTNIPTTTLNEYWASMMPGGSAEFRRVVMGSGVPVSVAGGMQVGDQVIQVMSGGRASTMALIEGSQVFSYPTTFHPSADVPSRATAVTLRSGEERTGVDLQLKLVRLARVTGAVTGSNGPVAHAGVRLFQTEIFEAGLDAGFETAMTTTNAAGHFTLAGVPPGQYIARVTRIPTASITPLDFDVAIAAEGFVYEGPDVARLIAAGRAAVPNEPTLWAQAPVSVPETGAADVQLLLREGLRVSGRVAFEGSAPPPPADRLAAFSVILLPSDGRTTLRPAAARLDAQSRFTTGQHVPGLYRLNHPTPPPWVLKSVMAGSRDLLVDGVVLSDSDLEGVVVTFSDTSTELSGAVTDAGRSAAAAVVFVCPAEVDRWIAGGMQTARSRTVVADAAGRFNISGLPPGDYVAVAVASDRAPDFRDPQVVKGFAQGGTRVTVALGDRSTVGLAVSRAR